MTLSRGNPGRIVVVGKGPGQTEQTSGRAFSGQAGRTLDKWLIASGQPKDEPRSGVYLTSLIKCGGAESRFEEMYANCYPFLFEQMEAVSPSIIITLGREAYEHLSFRPEPYGDAVCTIADSRENALFTRLGFHYVHLTWPHPSGRNRWMNKLSNRELLGQSFLDLRCLLRS